MPEGQDNQNQTGASGQQDQTTQGQAQATLLGDASAAGQQADSAQTAQDNQDPWEAEDWHKLVPEKFRDEKGELKIKDIAKSYIGLEKKLGAGEAPPKTPDEYKIDIKLPEGVELNKEQMKSFLASCHATGMTNKQVQHVMDRYAGVIGEQFKGQVSTKEQAEAELKKVWGDSYGENVAFAQKAFNALADDIDRAAVNQVGNSPAVLKMLAKIGRNLKEDTSPTGSPATGITEEEIQTLQRSKAYFDPKDPEHNAVKSKVTAYYQRKFTKKAG